MGPLWSVKTETKKYPCTGSVWMFNGDKVKSTLALVQYGTPTERQSRNQKVPLHWFSMEVLRRKHPKYLGTGSVWDAYGALKQKPKCTLALVQYGSST
jgi:hypothetical protein